MHKIQTFKAFLSIGPVYKREPSFQIPPPPKKEGGYYSLIYKRTSYKRIHVTKNKR